MNILKALLSFFSVFGVVTKWLPSIAAVSGLFGPLGPAIAAVLTFLVQLVKWFVEGLTAMLSNPVTFITASVFMCLAFMGGAKLSKEKYEAALARKDRTIAKMISDGEKADAAAQLKLSAAVEAATKAAREELLGAKPAVDDKPAPVSVVKRVRPATGGKGLSQVGGPSVQWFQDVFGTNPKGPAP